MKNVINRKNIHLPDKEELDKIILQILPEVSSLRIYIEKRRMVTNFLINLLLIQ